MVPQTTVGRAIRWRTLMCLCGLSLVLALAACGSSKSSSTSSSVSSSSASSSAAPATSGGTHLAKTKFVLHAGLAFGAFHRWIYGPLRAGDFSHPTAHKAAVLKAVLSAAFIVHELKLALGDAQADPTLSKLVAPLTALGNKLRALPADIKSGNAPQLDSANGAISAIKAKAASAGQSIKEQAPAVP